MLIYIYSIYEWRGSMKMPRKYAVVAVVLILLVSFSPVFSYGDDVVTFPSGFQGVSWKKVVPLDKVTLVQFDENSYIDDFAYMAAIPSAVFYDEKTDKVYSNPLLFYDESKGESVEELSLNARQGLDYFMEDWTAYTGRLKKIECINVKDTPWKADNYTSIQSSNIYEIASSIALHDWSYSKDAVMAVVGNVTYGSYNKTKSEIKGQISPREIKDITVTGIKQDSIAPQFDDFYVPEEYKYIKADLYWPSVSILKNFMFVATLAIMIGGLTIPIADPDLQLYCYYENELMEVSASQKWNIREGGGEHTETYVYNPGNWKAAIEDIPTKGLFGDRHGTIGQMIKDILTGQTTYYIDIYLYPGEEIEIPDVPPFMCRDANFELTWEGDGKLGLIILDENNVAVGQAVLDNVSKQTLHLDQLGRGKYKAVIVQLNETDATMSYTLKYSWEKRLKEKESNYIMNAAEGAVLASLINAPLLYVGPHHVPDCAEKAMKKLGVKKVYLVNLGRNTTTTIKSEIEKFGEIKKEYTNLIAMYEEIRNITHENDIVFTTIDPWSYWLLEKLKPEGEKNGALYVGTAAYAAAHHGCPLIAVDMHDELATAVVWYNEWWKLHAIRDIVPPVAEMYLSGRAVYEFLDKIGLDEPGKIESFITVAGQFDIGTPWDRTFAGPAYAGRILGTPVDTSYWVCRNTFYPAVIFANPALDENGITLINGSKSRRMPSGRLQILKPSQEEKFVYPVLNMWVTYSHRWNERASEYWGTAYICPNGITPFFDPSTNPIDNNIMAKYGKYGSYYPDMTESEVTPFYLDKAGYDVAYSTNFSATMENINRGVIMWMECTHGEAGNCGTIAFWSPYGVPGWFGINISLPTVEPNPWRGYELYLPGYLDGSTEEPDVLSQSKYLGLDIIPARLSDLPIIKRTFVGRRAGYDGTTISILFGRLRTLVYSGLDIDRALNNVHSAGFTGGSCLIANSYLHLTLIRHGFVFQLIDPWETSWYSAFAMQMFTRGLALGDTLGKAFTDGMLQTGIGYLTKQWWWDVKENICLFGDPDLKVYMPLYSWERPEPVTEGMVNGHAPFGTTEYPHEVQKGQYGLYVVGAVIIIFAIAGGYFGMKYKKWKTKQ